MASASSPDLKKQLAQAIAEEKRAKKKVAKTRLLINRGKALSELAEAVIGVAAESDASAGFLESRYLPRLTVSSRDHIKEMLAEAKAARGAGES